ncbi:hypothetical protein OFO10_06000 [Campylobacter sp. VBCF_06 NA8]|uniref:hypothetical protein n=1 Tax=Campylobacter sp. VBCF_06 NA8 TaxID=2983822 RepID=UPI0022E9F364|nr:hypothetical protein [Campylobacter sp. VBCF_06 NA8]MDA3046707.1 hypothetical protein [Campylobacter sp. VBCF_06 NA8]
MVYKYDDEYLAQGGVINDDMESRAIKEINQYALTNPFYIEKLTILKTYIICCIENQTQENDLYDIKLRHYKDEFSEALKEAKIDKLATQAQSQNGDNSAGISAFNCPLARG